MNFNVTFLLLFTLTIVGVQSHCPNQGKIMILCADSIFSHYYFFESSLISCKNSHCLCNLIHYFSGSQTWVWGEPHGGTLNVKLTDFILFGGHAYEKVVKLNVESRIYRKMWKNMPLATV